MAKEKVAEAVANWLELLYSSNKPRDTEIPEELTEFKDKIRYLAEMRVVDLLRR